MLIGIYPTKVFPSVQFLLLMARISRACCSFSLFGALRLIYTHLFIFLPFERVFTLGVSFVFIAYGCVFIRSIRFLEPSLNGCFPLLIATIFTVWYYFSFYVCLESSAYWDGCGWVALGINCWSVGRFTVGLRFIRSLMGGPWTGIGDVLDRESMASMRAD